MEFIKFKTGQKMKILDKNFKKKWQKIFPLSLKNNVPYFFISFCK